MTSLDDDIRAAAAQIVDLVGDADFRVDALIAYPPFRGVIEALLYHSQDDANYCGYCRAALAAITGRGIMSNDTGRGQGAALPSSPSAAPCPSESAGAPAVYADATASVRLDGDTQSERVCPTCGQRRTP